MRYSPIFFLVGALSESLSAGLAELTLRAANRSLPWQWTRLRKSRPKNRHNDKSLYLQHLYNHHVPTPVPRLTNCTTSRSPLLCSVSTSAFWRRLRVRVNTCFSSEACLCFVHFFAIQNGNSRYFPKYCLGEPN